MVRPIGAHALAVALPLCAFALVHCGEKSPQAKPTPPDMSALVQSYAQPTLVLDPVNVQAAFDVSVSVSSTVQTAVDLVPQVEAAVTSGLTANREQDQIGSSGNDKSKPLDVTGSGFLRVHRICPGPEPGAGPNEANGAMDLTVGFTEQGIDPVVWGTFSACQFLLAGEASTIDGSINLFVGENLAFDQFGTQPLLVQLSGGLTTSAGASALASDFRILPSGAFEYRVFVGDKHVIYWDDLTSRGFRAANGTWTCQFDNHLCTRNEDAQQFVW